LAVYYYKTHINVLFSMTIFNIPKPYTIHKPIHYNNLTQSNKQYYTYGEIIYIYQPVFCPNFL